jgi:hypothetical protein
MLEVLVAAAGRVCCAVVDPMRVLVLPQSAGSVQPTGPCHTRWLVLAGGWHPLLLLWVLSWPTHVVILATAKWFWGAACVLPLSFPS